MADAVVGARTGQRTPDGYYNVERMLKRVLDANGKVLLCGTCMDARGLDDAALTVGARRSTLDELAEATVEADPTQIQARIFDGGCPRGRARGGDGRS